MKKESDSLPYFSCDVDGVEVRFYQTRRAAGVCAPEFMLEVRGPGKAGQDEFVGRIKVEIAAHGYLEQFRRFLVLSADHGKPLELGNLHSTFKGKSSPSFYPPETVAYEVRTNQEGYKLVLPSVALREIRLEMIETKPPGDIDI